MSASGGALLVTVRRIGWGALALVLALWLLDAAGAGLPRAANQLLVLGALGALLLWLVLTIARLAEPDPERGWLTPGRVLLGLVGLSFVVKFTGLGFELVDHYHNDEGVFFATATAINGGRLFPDTFNYGHLLYYLSAIVLWLRELFPVPVDFVVRLVYGAEGVRPVGSLLLRAIAASFGALTTIPVFLIARKVGGFFAAGLAGVLIAVAPIYNEVTHLVISDVPSAFFATLTLYFVSKLLDGENLPDYLLAGVSAALAAASKYPAGVVAVAIIGIWVYWRIRTRRFSWSLVAAGAISVVTFLAVMPALGVHHEIAFAGHGRDLTFGYRQYANRGWVGSIPRSNTLWYGARLLEEFGVVALLFGVTGLTLLRGERGRRMLGMLSFPVVYLLLIISMNMVVKRNLLPVLPMLAALLATGIEVWRERLEQHWPARRVLGTAGLVLLCLAGPATRTLLWDVSRIRPGTRQVAEAWIRENIPWGAGIRKEAYAPGLNPKSHRISNHRYAARWTLDELRDPTWDYLLLAGPAHGRFMTEANLREPQHREYARRYKEMFTFPKVREFRPGPLRAGPHLALYLLDPEQPRYRVRRRFRASDALFLSRESMRPREEKGAIRFSSRGKWALFTDYFQPGSVEILVDTADGPPRGEIHVMSRGGEKIGVIEAGSGRRLVLPRADKYFFRAAFRPGSRLRGLEVRRSEESTALEVE